MDWCYSSLGVFLPWVSHHILVSRNITISRRGWVKVLYGETAWAWVLSQSLSNCDLGLATQPSWTCFLIYKIVTTFFPSQNCCEIETMCISASLTTKDMVIALYLILNWQSFNNETDFLLLWSNWAMKNYKPFKIGEPLFPSPRPTPSAY